MANYKELTNKETVVHNNCLRDITLGDNFINNNNKNNSPDDELEGYCDSRDPLYEIEECNDQIIYRDSNASAYKNRYTDK